MALAAGDPGVGLVVLLGVGIVFAGLLCMVGLCYLMNFVYDLFVKKDSATSAATSATAPVSAPAEIPNRQEMIDAVAAAIAEDTGKDLSAIRILSVKPL